VSVFGVSGEGGRGGCVLGGGCGGLIECVWGGCRVWLLCVCVVVCVCMCVLFV